MKVLLFIDNLGPGGKQRRLIELIKGLSNDSGIEMELVLTKTNIVYTEIFSTGIKIHYTIRKNFKKDPRVFFEFYRIARRFKPDIIHVWGNLEAIYAIPAKFLLNTPMLNNQITDAPSSFSSVILNYKLTFPFSNKIIANSYAGLKAYKAPMYKSLVIYNGFDFNRIKKLENVNIVREKYNIKTNFVVGMIGSFMARKDYSTYIKAAKEVINENDQTTFLCVGDGDYNQYKLLIDNDIKDRILFIEHQENIESLMNVCDVGVLATYTEGISNSLLEFMALSKPLVVTGGGGCAELVADNKNGYLMRSGDYKGIKEKLLYLLKNEKKRFEFGKMSKQIVLEKFSIKNMVNSFRKEYDSMLK